MTTGEGRPTGEDSAAAVGGNRARRAAAAVLVAAFAVLLPVAVTSAWIRGTVLSTSGYVAAVSPVAADPAVRDAVRELVTTQVEAALRHAEALLPPPARGLAGSLGKALAGLAGSRVSEFMASSAFRRLWAEVNRFAHRQVISILSGNSRLVRARGGHVVLNLVPLVNEVLHDISGHLSSLIGKSALGRARIALMPAAALAGPRRAYRILIAVTWLVLVLTPVAFVSALAVSPHRRRTLLQLAIGGTLTLLATGIALSWGRSSLIARAAPRYHALTSVIVHALTSGLAGLITWCLAGGLAVAAVALLGGRFSPDGGPGSAPWRSPRRPPPAPCDRACPGC